MRLIVLDTSGAECTYPIHQLLYLKLLTDNAALRFQGDITTYWLTRENGVKLFNWLQKKDSGIVKVRAYLSAP